MAEINYLNGYEIADAKAREDASEALENTDRINDVDAELQIEKSDRQISEKKLEDQIKSLASGSPKGVYATVSALETANPDTGVYIVSADGHIYSWTKNGSNAIDLGIYQSSGTAANSITMRALTNEVKNNMFTGNLAYYNLIEGYLDNQGSIQNPTDNKEVTTQLINLSNDKYVKINAIFNNLSLSWIAVAFFDENNSFIRREVFSPVTNERNYFINKPDNAKYCRLSYRTSNLEYIYFTTNSRINSNAAIVNDNFEGYTVMHEGEGRVKKREIIENTSRYKITYEFPYRCVIYLKSVFVTNLGAKEFTIAQKTDGSLWDIDQRYYIYYDPATDGIKYRSISTAWNTNESEFRKYILIGFVNNTLEVFKIYGQNFDAEFQDKLCGIINGFNDNMLPTVISNHFKLARDTILFYNNQLYRGDNQVVLAEETDIDLSTIVSTAVKIFYLKDLSKVVAVSYSAYTYNEEGIDYYLKTDNSILIAIIRTTQKLISINSPYIYDGKLFGLDLEQYANSKRNLLIQKRLGTVANKENTYGMSFFITEKLPKGTKFTFNGSDGLYRWAVVELNSETLPDYNENFVNDSQQTDSGYLYYRSEYITQYDGYKAVILSYKDTTKVISINEDFNEYFNVSLPYKDYNDSIQKEMNNINLDKKLNLNYYPSRLGSKARKGNLNACVLVIDNKLPAGSKINFKQVENKDYRWAIVEASETIPQNDTTLYDSGWKTSEEGNYVTKNEAYIFLTLSDKNNENLTNEDLQYLYKSFEIIPNNQINSLNDKVEQIDYDEKKIKLIDLNKNVKAVNHRGFNTVAPENTLPAYKLSKQKGFFYVETDVSFTSDGIPVCLHDNTINRTARNADGSAISETININNISFADVREYDFGIYKGSAYAGTKIPSFEEFLLLCKNIGLHPYIELKDSATYTETQIQGLVDMVKRAGMEGKVTWISFSLNYLTYVRNYDNKARLGYLQTPSATTINAAIQLKTQYNEVFMDSYSSSITDSIVNQCIAANLPIEAWTINSENAIKSLDSYVSGVTSDSLIAGEVLYNANIN